MSCSYYLGMLLCYLLMLCITFCGVATFPAMEDLDKGHNFQRKGQGQNESRKHHVDLSPDKANSLSLLKCLPDSWQQMCTVEFKFVSGSNFTSHRAVVVSCDLMEHDYWSLYTYRNWISANEENVYKNLPIREGLLFAFEFTCVKRSASVSLPWPVKAKYIWYISVQNCTILDYHAEYNTELNITDDLRVVNFVNSEFKINSEQFILLLSNYEYVSKQFDCGGLQLEKFVKRNCTVYFTETEEDQVHSVLENKEMKQYRITVKQGNTSLETTMSMNNTHPSTHNSLIPTEEEEMMDKIAKYGQKYQQIGHQCSYANLHYVDESYSTEITRHHGHFTNERFRYPALQFYNMSHSTVHQLSPMFLEWRRYFPRMQYLDMSYNKIKYFSTLSDQGLQNDSIGVFDLRHNNITTLTSEDLETLRLHSSTVFVNIRDNPLNCDCKLTHFVMQLKNTSSELVQKYEYLKHMKCASPIQLKGKRISELENDFCETAELVILAAPLAILSTFVVVMVLVLGIIFKCREEIMILAFTRLHVRLPFRQRIKNEDKIYDAFIAYSENDAQWVINTLLPRLELPVENNGPGLKLCIHHRDFPIGGSIADNILDKVKNSNHTVLILSNNFLISNWCKYEFKTAFSQSLMEKKRHLIMIIKEELDKHLIDTELNRCLKTFTYVKADDRLFWDKIVYALSDGIRKKRNIDHGLEMAEEDANKNHLPVHVINVNDDQNDENDINIPVHLFRHGDRNNTEVNRMLNNHGLIQDGLWNI